MADKKLAPTGKRIFWDDGDHVDHLWTLLKEVQEEFRQESEAVRDQSIARECRMVADAIQDLIGDQIFEMRERVKR